tara:strand:+ start:375 stop:557 length:183 start_codon:yes stop_codon:yes gene_type:complete
MCTYDNINLIMEYIKNVWKKDESKKIRKINSIHRIEKNSRCKKTFLGKSYMGASLDREFV